MSGAGRSRARAAVAGCACVAAVACSPSELVLVVHSDLQVPQEIDMVAIATTGAGGAATPVKVHLAEPSAPGFPLTLGLRAGGDPAAVTVEVTGLLGDVPVVSQRVRTGFVRGEIRLLAMELLDDCRTRRCEPGQTCGAMGCRGEEIAAADLPPWTGRLPPRPATPPQSTLPDAGTPLEVVVSDEFDDGVIDAIRWKIGFGRADADATTSTSLRVIEREGALQIEPQPDRAKRFRGCVSAGTFDFRGGVASVELLEVTRNGGQTVFALDTPAGSHVFRVRWESKTKFNFVWFEDTLGVFEPAAENYRAALHRFWRFRHDADEGTLHWEVSGTARGPWMVRRSVSVNAASMQEVSVALYAGTQDSVPSNPGPGIARFDNFVLARPPR